MGEVHTHKVTNIIKIWAIYGIPVFLLYYYLIGNLMNTLDYKIKMFENIILVIPFIIIVFVKVFKNSGVFLFLVYTFAFPFILPIIVLFFLQKLLKLPVVLVKMLI